MQIPGKKNATADNARRLRQRPRFAVVWRRGLRVLHRDAGYLAVGLTFVYALSGLAVNHIEDWDPNFVAIQRAFQLPTAELPSIRPSPGDSNSTANAAQRVLRLLGRGKELPLDAYATDAEHFDITLQKSTLYVDLSDGTVREEGQKPRLLLRVANWLHLNRGKKAWTLIADGYAVFLLFLATSGLFMLPGRKGLWGRGGLLAVAGASIPILYVVLSGGP